MENGNYLDAFNLFETLYDYKDVPDRMNHCLEMLYGLAVEHESRKEYAAAYDLYVFLKDYKDSLDRRAGLFRLTKKKYSGYSRYTSFYEYDADNILIKEVKDSSEFPSEMTYRYGEDGKLISSLETGINGRIAASGKISSTFEAVYTYDEWENLISISKTSTDQYFAKGKKKTTLEEYKYTYDESGKILSKETYFNGKFSTARAYRYEADELGRILYKFEVIDGEEKYRTAYTYNEDGLLVKELTEGLSPNTSQYGTIEITYSYELKK